MAIAPDSVWELRTTGLASNGAGYSAVVGGVGSVDYSQQDAAALTRTDATCNAGTTTVTLPTGGFTADMVGNVMTFTIAAVFLGYRQITAFVSTTQVTIDSNAPGTSAGAATIRVGGAGKIDASGFGVAAVAGNKVWIKAGTYTVVSTTPTAASGATVLQPIIYEGYNTTRGDITLDPTLTRPVLLYGANTINLLLLGGTAQIVRALEFDNRTNATGQSAVVFNNSSANCILENCIIRGLTAGGGLETVSMLGFRNTFRRNYLIAGTGNSDGLWVGGTGGGHVVAENHITSQSNPNNFSGVISDVGQNFFRNNIIERFTFGLIGPSASLSASNVQSNAFHRCVHGIYISNAAQGIAHLPHVRGNIFSRLTNGIRYNPANISANTGAIQWAAVAFDCNFFYSVTNNYSQLPAGTGDTTLTADPFTDEATGDFSLNNNTGGGAVVRDTVCAGVLPDGVNTVRLTAGALGEPEFTAPSDLSSMISLWREATGEPFSVITDQRVAIYLDYGLQQLNRLLHYHETTDGGGVTLVAETQGYSVSTDTISILEVWHNGVRLEKTSIEREEQRGEAWREKPSGLPQRWAHEAGTLYLFPKPNAAAVAASSSLTVRRVNTPGAIETYGAEQLPTSEHRLAVLYGAYLWALTPYCEWGRDLAAGLKDAFESGVAAVSVDYSLRGVAR